MPTGYTHELLSKKQTFSQFALTCARAFGAYIHMRDDSIDAEERPQEPSTYHLKAIWTAKRKLKRLQRMTVAQFNVLAKRESLKHAASRVKSRKSDEAENALLEAMSVQVRAWHEPTPDHANLKAFMLEQIETSLHDLSFYDRDWFPVAQTRKEAMADVRKDIAQHEKAEREEVERIEKATKWVKALKESLT